MPTFREIARSVRHAPGLERMDFLWNAVRTPYYALAKRRGGVTLTLGGQKVRVPVEFADQGWESYERAAMRAFVRWLLAHPIGTVIDVGCAVGLYTHVALSVIRGACVYAIDADLPSLAATKRLTGGAARGRRHLLRGFIGDEGSGTLEYAEQAARDAVGGTPAYQFLRKNDSIPTYTLDALFADRVGGQVLLKIDIEGAELLALRGAARLLSRENVTLLVSVHPVHLARDFGASADDVRALLIAAGYRITLLGIDHEEHWWCERV